METNEEKNKVRRTPYVGGEPVPGTLVEMLHRPETMETLFAIYQDGEVRYAPFFTVSDTEVLVPYRPDNNLIKNRIVLFPSCVLEYEAVETLVCEIKEFIHRYVTVTTAFETIAAYYVLLTWIYESFTTLPYLRARGDFGSGKTRFLTVIGSLCFRATFAGTTTVSPLFRMLDAFRGTVVIDEGDFRMTDERADITKLLNNGNSRGFPVLRSEQIGKGAEFNPVAFNVFSPKVVATRGYYDDPALESRFISEDMGRNEPRREMPLHLPESFSKEADILRSKLLMFRFQNFRKYLVSDSAEGVLEPRISQIFAPLLTIVCSETERAAILDVIRNYSDELSLDRTTNIETQIVEVIKELWKGDALTIKTITSRLNEKYREEYQELVSSKRVGFVVRKSLRLPTRRRAGTFEIPPIKQEAIEKLYQRFSVESG